jgi:MFS family permease
LSFLSISSFYTKSQVSYWSIGTGLARLFGTGAFLLMNRWISLVNIFMINLVLYLLVLGVGIYLLEYRKFIQSSSLEFKEEEFQVSKFWKNIFWMSLPLTITYFISYFYNFFVLPLLVMNDFEFQLTLFLNQIGTFLGRTLGSRFYVWWIGWLHLYSLTVGLTFFLTLIYQVQLPFIVMNFLFIFVYFINGLTYPMTYHHLYHQYNGNSKERVMGMVGQFTSFSSMIGLSIGMGLSILYSKLYK